MVATTTNVTKRDVLRLALIYMMTGFATFLAMGLLGLAMRLNHAGWIHLSADTFYRIMTIHGTGMVTGVLLAAMGGVIAVLNEHTQLSVKWLGLAFGIYFMSLAFVLIAVLGGNYAGAWTSLDPLPYHGLTWHLWAGVVMYIGFFFVAIGFLIYCLHLLFAITAEYGSFPRALGWPYLFSRGRNSSYPLPRPTELAAVVVSILGLVTAIGGAAVLIPLFLQAGHVIHVNTLYAKNFQMFFGHALANLSIYLAIGIVYAILPRYTDRPWPTSWLVIFAWNLVILLVLTPVSHHLYQDFAQPFPLQILGQVASYAAAPPIILVTIFSGLSLVYRSSIRWTAVSVLIVLGFWGWVFGGMAAVLDSTIAVNNVTHNTMWVPAHFHTYYLLGVASFTWGFLYFLVHDLSGKTESRRSRFAGWLYGIGAVGFVLMFFFAGAHGVPRRYANHLPAWHIYAEIAVPFVVILGIALAWISTDIVLGLRRAWQGAERAK